MSQLQAGLFLLAFVPLLWGLMWLGWRARGRRHDLPPLLAVPTDRPEPRLQGDARYFGTTVSGHWLDRVVAQGLGTRSVARLALSEDGLDVLRLAGMFRIPLDALLGARHELGIAGKVVPPHGLLVLTWQHGDLVLDSGFRLVDGSDEAHETWIRTITDIVDQRKDAA